MKNYHFLIVLLLLACRKKEPPNNSFAESQPIGIDQIIEEQEQYAAIGPTKLSAYGFFKGKMSDLIPGEGIFPYKLNTPLFTDYSKKKRFIYLPKGKKIEYRTNEVFGFPIGTILIKNFYYSANQLEANVDKILETRLLVNEKTGWKALPYIWNDEQTEAYLEITGGVAPISHQKKGTIKYTIPDMNQCKSCHDRNGKMTPIGPSARQLNLTADGMNKTQLEIMAKMGWIELPETALPKIAKWDVVSSGTIDQRARAYLDINCAHCHNDAGPAKNSGLNLRVFETDPYRLGINKKPVAAGRGSGDLIYGITPGHPDKSILLHRMITNEPGTMMPELGRTMPHDEGIALIREWIQKL